MMHNEYAANRALAATPRGPSAYRRRQRQAQVKQAASNALGGIAFLILLACCFIPLFL